MMEVGYRIVVDVDQSTSGVHEALSKASDSHCENVEKATRSLIRKFKATRKYHLKMMEARWLVIIIISSQK